MSERYSRLFALPEDLYCAGSPVVIAAGTLLKDNQNGKVIAQLKLRSISEKTIKAVKVRLNLFDTAGNPLGDSVEYSYLDLNAGRDAEFGQKSPIAVADAKSRSYQAAVTEVVFADQSVWTANDEKWESLAKPSPLPITDPELLKQYQMHYGSSAKYAPKAEKDLWHCTCGSLNHEDESCHVCGHSLAELQSLDMAKLTAEKDARLEEAARKAAEEQAAADAQKKKTTKILAIVIPAVCAVVAIVLLITNVIIPNSKYNNAVALMDAGRYEEAIVAFEAMDGYKDSVQKIADCEQGIIERAYTDAVALLESGSYEEAITAFELLHGYKDSHEKIKDCQLSIALTYIEDGNLIDGYNELVALDGYKDSTEIAESVYDQYLTENLRNAQIGSYITFGSYEQNGNAYRIEEIEWLVLDKTEDRILVISRYILDRHQYHRELTAADWESSSLRKWLNDEFYDAAFSEAEKARIPTVTIHSHSEKHASTEDKLFLLSIPEVNAYFDSEQARVSKSTEYANYSLDAWWLRSYGSGQATLVFGEERDAVNYETGKFIGGWVNASAGVRPAMWISIEP